MDCQFYVMTSLQKTMAVKAVLLANYSMTTHQMWSNHVTPASTFQKFYLCFDYALNPVKGNEILRGSPQCFKGY